MHNQGFDPRNILEYIYLCIVLPTELLPVDGVLLQHGISQ